MLLNILVVFDFRRLAEYEIIRLVYLFEHIFLPIGIVNVEVRLGIVVSLAFKFRIVRLIWKYGMIVFRRIGGASSLSMPNVQVTLFTIIVIPNVCSIIPNTVPIMSIFRVTILLRFRV